MREFYDQVISFPNKINKYIYISKSFHSGVVSL